MAISKSQMVAEEINAAIGGVAFDYRVEKIKQILDKHYALPSVVPPMPGQGSQL